MAIKNPWLKIGISSFYVCLLAHFEELQGANSGVGHPESIPINILYHISYYNIYIYNYIYISPLWIGLWQGWMMTVHDISWQCPSMSIIQLDPIGPSPIPGLWVSRWSFLVRRSHNFQAILRAHAPPQHRSSTSPLTLSTISVPKKMVSGIWILWYTQIAQS